MRRKMPKKKCPDCKGLQIINKEMRKGFFPIWITCPICNGTGKVPVKRKPKQKKCTVCEGRKKVTYYADYGDTELSEMDCCHCDGTGIEPSDKEKGIFKKPTAKQCRKVAEVIRRK
jgi:ssDNA-binding Zn-finger/Zn-ribbon topoisomerase 1